MTELEQLHDALGRIRSLHRRLAGQDAIDEEGEAELRDAWRDRDRLLRQLGARLLAPPAEAPAPNPTENEAAAPPVPAPPAPSAPTAPAGPVAPTPAPPASLAQLAALAAGGIGPRWTEGVSTAPDDGVKRILGRLGPPADARPPGLAEAELQRLEREVERLAEWDPLPDVRARAVIGLVSSRARHLQDEVRVGGALAARLADLFPRMTRWSAERRPGWVPGLTRQQPPARGTWLADARGWWEELGGPGGGDTPSIEAAIGALDRALAARPIDPDAIGRAARVALQAGLRADDDRLTGRLRGQLGALAGAELKGLRKAIGRRSEETPGGARDLAPAPPELRTRTEGRAAVIVGGDRRSSHEERLRRVFGFSSVRWEATDPRRVGALCERVRGGAVGVVILVRALLSHAVQERLVEACRAAGVPFCVVDTGYGPTQVGLALSRYLGLQPADPA